MKKLFAVLLAWLLMVSPSMAAISFIDSAGNSASPNGTFSVAIPGTCAAGDLLIVGFVVGDTTGADNDLAVNGFTEISDQSIATDTSDVELFTGYRYMVGGDTTVPISGTFTALGGTNASNAAVVMCFRGVKTSGNGGPFDTAATPATGQDSSDANPPSHDWSGAAGVWTVIVGATGHTGGATGAFTCPANYTTNCVQRNHDDNGTDALIGMGYNSSPSDPENPAAFTAANIGTEANNSWAAVTISLSEAAAPTCTAGLNLTLLGVGGCP